MKYFLGLDLGQAQDYTALALLEKVPQWNVEMVERVLGQSGGRQMAYMEEVVREAPPHYRGHALKRFQLGTQYPEIAQEVRAIMNRPELKGKTQLVVDATGVGRPVVDMLRRLGLQLIPVTITAGDSANFDKGYWRVPKRDLVATVQVLLQAQRLKFAVGAPLVDTLVKELLAFRVTITASAHDSYGAWRERDHDDLVLAVAMAAWRGERAVPRIRPEPHEVRAEYEAARREMEQKGIQA